METATHLRKDRHCAAKQMPTDFGNALATAPDGIFPGAN
jgi:hypothetical protein